MNLDFDLTQINTVEFGVGREDGVNQTFCLIAVGGDVQTALSEMANATWNGMHVLNSNPSEYMPSEKYLSHEYVYLPIDHPLADRARELHQATNLETDTNALKHPENVFCYFARFTDKRGRRLTGLRRASQFKGVLKSRLIRLASDALKLIEDRVFKLDSDFDLLVDAKNVHILRVSSFESVGKLQKAVLAAVPDNIKAIQLDIEFVNFESILSFASKHPRAARYLASIRSQKETNGIDKAALKKLCKNTGVEIMEVKGKVTVLEGHVMGFLEVLDRRRYEVELVKDTPERFKAASRQKIES